MSSEPQFKPVTVDKPIPVSYDLGNLAVFDANPLDNAKLDDPAQRDAYLEEVTRDNAQLLVNQILSLPLKSTTDASGTAANGQSSTMTLVQLPLPLTDLPREKPIPKAKTPTKWELFAAKKGIQAKGKEGKKMFDEDAGEWVNKWGYKGNNKKLDNQWLVEVDEKIQNTDKELIDPRTLDRAERKKLVKRNELQHKRNVKNAEGK